MLITNKNTTPPIDAWPSTSSTIQTSFPAGHELMTSEEETYDEGPLFVSSQSSSSDNARRHSGLVFTESRPSTLRCLAIGNSLSPPSLRLHIGRRDVTADFRLSSRSLSTAGPVGMRLVRYVVELWRHDFRPDVSDRGKRISCSAFSAHGAMTNATSVRLILNC